MYFSHSATSVVVLAQSQHQKKLKEAIENGAPQCKIHYADDQEAAYKLIASFQQSGTQPDFLIIDALSVDSEPATAVSLLRRLTDHGSPIVLLLEDSASGSCKSYGANSCIDRKPESISAAAEYWAHINLVKPGTKRT